MSFGTETQENPNYQLYGHYALESNTVNDRPYFRMNTIAIWWDKIGNWWIGSTVNLGQSGGWAYYTKDAFCPHQLNEWKWKALETGLDWIDAGKHLGVTCKDTNYLVLLLFHQNDIRTKNPHFKSLKIPFIKRQYSKYFDLYDFE